MKKGHASGAKNRGFSLVELLVAITIIAILIAILLPAVQQARTSARTMQCKNNMHQIGLAMHNYHETNRVLPPGLFNYLGDDIPKVVQPDGTTGVLGPSRSCWMQRILPYLDQQALYSQMPFDSNVEAYEWGSQFKTPIWTIVPSLMCSVDPANPKVVTDRGTGPEDSEGFHGNIVMCAGSTEFGVSGQSAINGTPSGTNLNGLFYALSSTNFADVTDGLTNTIMGSELIITPDGTVRHERDNRGRYYNNYRGGALFSTQYPPNTSIADEFDFCMPNPAAPCNQSGANPQVMAVYSRSYHHGGVNVILGDGSVRFVSENISTDLFRSLGTRAGSETLSDF